MLQRFTNSAATGEYVRSDRERGNRAQRATGQGVLGHEQAGRAVQAGAGRGGGHKVGHRGHWSGYNWICLDPYIYLCLTLSCQKLRM